MKSLLLALAALAASAVPASAQRLVYQTVRRPVQSATQAPQVIRSDTRQPVTQPILYRQVQTQAAQVQMQAQQVQTQTYGDPYGFLGWLNATRASYGLSVVGYDPNLAAWASQNNAQQNSRGMGHHVMGPARRQNAAMGSYASVPGMWMASPAHRAALLDPTIRFIGIAGAGAYWTFNAY